MFLTSFVNHSFKNITAILLLFLCVCYADFSQAAESDSKTEKVAKVEKAEKDANVNSSEWKIGYVDVDRIRNDVEEGKQAVAKLKKDFESKQKKLDQLQNDLKAKKDAFDKKAELMKPEARASKEQELQQDLMDLQRTYVQLQQELAENQKQITDDITRKIRTVVEKIGDKENYFLILNTGETVLYNKRHLDLTDEVIREYNKLYGKK